MALACAGYEKEVLAVHARLISLCLSLSLSLSLVINLLVFSCLINGKLFSFIHHFTQIDIFSKSKSEKMPTMVQLITAICLRGDLTNLEVLGYLFK